MEIGRCFITQPLLANPQTTLLTRYGFIQLPLEPLTWTCSLWRPWNRVHLGHSSGRTESRPCPSPSRTALCALQPGHPPAGPLPRSPPLRGCDAVPCVLTRAHTCSHGSVRGCLALSRRPTSMNTAAPELQRLRSLVVSLCRLEPWRWVAWLRGASFPPGTDGSCRPPRPHLEPVRWCRRVRGPCGVSARPRPARPTSSHVRCCSCVSLSRITSWATSRWVVGLSSSSPLVEACAPVCGGALARPHRPFQKLHHSCVPQCAVCLPTLFMLHFCLTC